MNKYRIVKNLDFGSHEIFFEGIPEKETREALKALKFRWNPKKMCWYGFAELEEIEKACNNVLVIPDYEKTEVGTLYEGWKGGNNNKWTTETELKKFILADLKKCGIKATLRFRRGGYTTAFTLTITIKPEHIKDFESWKNENHRINFNSWNYMTDEAGKIQAIFGEKLINCNDLELLENIARTEYKMAVDHLTASGTYHNECEEILTSDGNAILHAATEILNSYNHDNSNSQIDYFDVSFYKQICFKLAA